MKAPNYMVFSQQLSRAIRTSLKGGNALREQQTRYAAAKALERYKAKDYVMAEQWRNSAERASLGI